MRAAEYAGLSGELFRYSTISMEWTLLDEAAGVMGTSPGGRYRHAMAAVGSDVYVFGGNTYGISGKGAMGGWGEITLSGVMVKPCRACFAQWVYRVYRQGDVA